MEREVDMNMDKVAQERIKELEEDLDAQAQRIELLEEYLAERDVRIKVLEHDLMMLRSDRRFEVA